MRRKATLQKSRTNEPKFPSSPRKLGSSLSLSVRRGPLDLAYLCASSSSVSTTTVINLDRLVTGKIVNCYYCVDYPHTLWVQSVHKHKIHQTCRQSFEVYSQSLQNFIPLATNRLLRSNWAINRERVTHEQRGGRGVAVCGLPYLPNGWGWLQDLTVYGKDTFSKKWPRDYWVV